MTLVRDHHVPSTVSSKCQNRTKLQWCLASGRFLSHKLMITAIIATFGMSAGSFPAGGCHVSV
jgi:hypothetical protein